MDSPKLLVDDLWSLMQSDPDMEMGCEFQLEEEESDDGNLADPFSEDASSSSSELVDCSSAWPVHFQHKFVRTKSSARSPDAATATRSGKPSTLSSPPSSSCLGKRDRNNELKVKVSSKERSVVLKESKWAVQLLMDCAEAIASSNIQRTQHLMWVLNDLGCLTGDANQRLAAYGLKALFAKVAGTVDAASAYHQSSAALNSALKNFHNALLKFHDLHPWHQMVYSATIGVLLDSLEGKKQIHVIDIGISQGTQWPTLIEALATRPSGPPDMLRLTIVEDSRSGISMNSSMEVKSRLERFAKVMGLNMELRLLDTPLDSLTRDSFELAESEAVAVCAHFRLATISKVERQDSEVSPRDRFLKFVHDDLKPELMILGENDLDNSSVDFVACCREVIEHHWRFLDSMNSAFKGHECDERQIIEHLVSAGMIHAIAGEEPKNERRGQWSMRMSNAGFVAEIPQDEVTETVRMLVRKNDSFWELRNDENCFELLWKHQPVTFCSIWR